jgi:putative tryptophan/tyrosine transport system substrate-binding protein
MTRRAFLATVGVGLVATPLVAAAQSARKSPRVGFLTATRRGGHDGLFEAFRQGLGELGWSEGRNLILDYRVAESDKAVPHVSAELVKHNPDVVLLSATVIHGARAVTGRIPTVFVVAEDPVRAGLVESLARPGGHTTGLTSLNIELDGKRLEMLRGAMPGVTRVGALATSQDPTSAERVAAAEQAARALGLRLHVLDLPAADRFTSAFEAARADRLEALMLIGSPPFFAYQPRIAQLAVKTRIPVISAWREFPDAGGLMSYGTSVPAMFRRAASYVDRILKGANPGHLPVERASTFELVLNLNAARDLGVTMPPSLMLRADHVIQ